MLRHRGRLGEVNRCGRAVGIDEWGERMADLNALRARFQQDWRRLEEVRRELRSQTFEGASEDGRIAVTVNADGRLDEVRFDPRVFRPPVDSDGIAVLVKYAYDRAIEAAFERKQALYGSIFGPGMLEPPARDGEDEAVQAMRLGRALLERAESPAAGTEERHD